MDGWNWTSICLVFATLMGPILAVQAQKFLEHYREKKQRRIWVFRTLMLTRASMMSPDYVNAYNAIPLEFHGAGKEKAIVDAWKLHLKHLEKQYKEDEVAAWSSEGLKIFNDMMYEMSKFLGYSFSRVEIEGDIYSPKGHQIIENDTDIIRNGLAKLFNGKFVLPMKVESIPSDSETTEDYKAVQKSIIKWMESGAPVTVVSSQIEQKSEKEKTDG